MAERDLDYGQDNAGIQQDETVAPLVPAAAKPADRLRALDLLKGFIMVVMALDHAKHGFAGPPGASQDPVPLEIFFTPADYSGPAAWWWTREITHLCAVGFAFAMGVGMEFFMRSRTAFGWTWAAFVKYYALRCVVLIVLEQVGCVCHCCSVPDQPRCALQCLQWGVSYLIPAVAGECLWLNWPTQPAFSQTRSLPLKLSPLR
jgi:uncharacterized membrane protein